MASLKHLAFALIVQVVQVQSAFLGDQCNADTYVPSELAFDMPSPSDYPFVYSGLQIFTNLEVPCAGQLIRWKFVAKNKQVHGLHLAIFRKKTALAMELVGMTKIDLQDSGVGDDPAWVNYDISQPIPVMPGDYLGMFYDKIDTRSGLLTVPSLQRPRISGGVLQPTIVLLVDNDYFRRNRTISIEKATRVNRMPALAAVIDGTEDGEVSTATPPEPIRYLPGYCTLYQKAYTPDDFQRDPPSYFPFVEAGLQIFTKLQIPCTGYLTRWEFIAKNRIIRGLHLGVFRPRATGMQLVGENLFDGVFSNITENGDWIAIDASPPIPVNQGDYIGMYYSKPSVYSGDLIIPSRDPAMDGRHKMALTYVKMSDSSSLKLDAKIDLVEASLASRLPALAALVEYLRVPPPPIIPNQCATTVAVPPEFATRLPSPFIFTNYEAGLQVFTYMQIPCSGTLVQWQFVVNNMISIFGLHLAVFRPNDFDPYIELVGENSLAFTAFNGQARTTMWVTRRADPPIQVRQGDYIGMFYEKMATSNIFLTIPSSIDSMISERGNNSLSTLVFLLDNSVIRKNRFIDTTNATKVTRTAALIAVVQGSNGGYSSTALPEADETMPPTRRSLRPRRPTSTPRRTSRRLLTTTATLASETTSTTTTTTITTTKTKTTTTSKVTTTTTKKTTTEAVTTRPQLVTQNEQPISIATAIGRYRGVDERTYVQTAKATAITTKTKTTPSSSSVTPPPQQCFASPSVPKNCQPQQYRFFHDYFSGLCRSIWGCPSPFMNANNFGSMSECNSVCKPLGEERAPECFMTPGAPILCEQVATRYYFSSTTTTCAPFIGCPSTVGAFENNFASLDDCSSRCRASNVSFSVIVQRSRP